MAEIGNFEFQVDLSSSLSFAWFSLSGRDFGQGKDADCDALLASVQRQDPQGVVLKNVQTPDKSTTAVR
jgi:hypothetical protein